MGVRLVGEHYEEPSLRLKLLPVADPLQRDEAPAAPQPAPPGRPPQATPAQIMELMAVLARILGFRLQLLLAFLGAAGLGAYAAVHGGVAAGVSAGLYDACVLLPILWVAYKRG